MTEKELDQKVRTKKSEMSGQYMRLQQQIQQTTLDLDRAATPTILVLLPAVILFAGGAWMIFGPHEYGLGSLLLIFSGCLGYGLAKWRSNKKEQNLQGTDHLRNLVVENPWTRRTGR